MRPGKRYFNMPSRNKQMEEGFILEVGERIFTNEGKPATIIYVANPREFYPIGLLLDEPDENGHKNTRVAASEIKPQIEAHTEVAPAEPKPLKRFVAEVNKRRNGYTIGTRFVVSERDHNNYFHVYLMDRPNNGPVGSYVTDFFKIITPFEEQAIKPQETAQIKELKINEPNIPKVDKKATGAKKRSKNKELSSVPDGQMSIFDILEG